MTRTLSALLAPSSLALVGASDDATRIGGRPLRYLREAGFAGRIYPVNPKYDEFTNRNTCPVRPGSASIGTANSAGPFSGSWASSKSRIAL